MKTFSFKSLTLCSISLFGLSLILSGCGGGGGGGGGSAPSPAPYTPPSVSVPPTQAVDNTVYATTDNIGDNVWYTNEYFANDVHNRIGSYGAYQEGYTGNGVTVAVVDSGVDAHHSDLDSNILEGRDMTAFHYDTSNGNLYYTSGGIGSDQVGEIFIQDGGSGYSFAPSVTVNGDGTGATAIAILDGAGAVEGVYITDHGTGYTNVSFSIDDSGTDGSGLSISSALLGNETLGFHGTAVSGLIVAERSQLDPSQPYSNDIHGVAFNSKILPVKVFDNYGNATTRNVHLGIDYARTHGAQIINLSLGSNSVQSITNDSLVGVYKSSLQNNITMVVAAGNEGLNCLAVNGSIDGQCSFPAALPWVSGYEDLLTQDGGWIVAGAVDSDNKMASWSNKAGVTKNNYLVAPGVNILTTTLNNQLTVASGTSFAAPIISGAVALMTEKYPHLTGSQVSEILFSTATDLGDIGTDDVYGRGLLNIEKAFSPIGSLNIPTNGTVNKSTTPLSNTSFVAGRALSGAMIKISSINNTIAVDDFGRDFKISMSNSVSVSPTNDFSFDRFSMINYDGLLMGFNEFTQEMMIGYTKNNYSLMLSATDGIFGSTSTGALALNKQHSYYATLNKYIQLDQFMIVGSADYGLATAKAADGSLISKMDNLHALGGSVIIQDIKSGWGLGYKIPLKVISGNMNFNIPVSRNINGTVNYSNFSESMVSDATEQRFSVFNHSYLGNLGVKSSLEMRMNEFNNANSPTSYFAEVTGYIRF